MRAEGIWYAINTLLRRELGGCIRGIWTPFAAATFFGFSYCYPERWSIECDCHNKKLGDFFRPISWPPECRPSDNSFPARPLTLTRDRRLPLTHAATKMPRASTRSLDRASRVIGESGINPKRNPAKSRHATQFHDRVESGCDAGKKRTRRRVAQFVAGIMSAEAAPRLLTLPGSRFVFENEFDEYVGSGSGVSFLCFERDEAVFSQAAKFMPGVKERSLCQWRTQYGFIDVVTNETKAARFIRSGKNAYVMADVIDFAELKPKCTTWAAPDKWNKYFKSATAVWLDTFSPLGCQSMHRLMGSVDHFFHPDVSRVPFCLSFIIGRDNAAESESMRAICPGGDALERRAAYFQVIAKRLKGWDVDLRDMLSHHSANGDASLTVGTIMSVLTRTPNS